MISLGTSGIRQSVMPYKSLLEDVWPWMFRGETCEAGLWSLARRCIAMTTKRVHQSTLPKIAHSKVCLPFLDPFEKVCLMNWVFRSGLALPEAALDNESFHVCSLLHAQTDQRCRGSGRVTFVCVSHYEDHKLC